jgi:hypothetical protein
VTPKQIREVASWMGRRSYKVRLERLGIARLQDIARENGKKGGRPKGSGKATQKAKKGQRNDRD